MKKARPSINDPANRGINDIHGANWAGNSGHGICVENPMQLYFRSGPTVQCRQGVISMPEGTPDKPPTLEYAPRPALAWIGRRRNLLILLALVLRHRCADVVVLGDR